MNIYKPCTHPNPPTYTQNRLHPPTPSQEKITLTHIQPKKMVHTPTPSQKKVTLTYNHPYPASKRSHSPTTIHTQPKKGPHSFTPSQKKSYSPNHYLPKKRSYPPESSRISMDQKVFHYPLVNQIYQKLHKS